MKYQLVAEALPEIDGDVVAIYDTREQALEYIQKFRREEVKRSGFIRTIFLIKEVNE